MKKVIILVSVKDDPNSIGVHQNKYLKDTELVIDQHDYDNVEIFLSSNEMSLTIDTETIPSDSYVYLTGCGKNRELSSTIAILLKQQKQNFSDLAIADVWFGGKLVQLSRLKENNILFPKTYFISTKQLKAGNLGNVLKYFKFPFVFKETNANQGSNNYLIKNEEDFNKIPRLINGFENNINFIFQEFIPNDFDYRILTLKDSVGSVEKRIRQNKDEHRNNHFLGAKGEYVKVENTDNNLKEISIKAAKAMKRDIAGVDIIVNKENGEIYVIEVNPFPGITWDTGYEEDALTSYFLKQSNL